MALREVRTNPDPILRKNTREIDKVTPRIQILVEDMIDTMRHAEGVGLAAPQIGVLKKLAVVEVEEQLYVLINPVIIKREGEEIGPEGCLSVPGKQGLVKRPKNITLKYKDLNEAEMTLEASDFLARAICHELDHLNGVLYIDKLASQEEYQAQEQNQ